MANDTENGFTPPSPAPAFATLLVGLYLVATGAVAVWLLINLFPTKMVLDAMTATPSPVRVEGTPPATASASRTSTAAATATATSPAFTPPSNGAGETASATPTATPTTKTAAAAQPSPPATAGGCDVMPSCSDPERCLFWVALLAGIIGSFMHAGQSFAAYIGNRRFARSWIWWYVLRPPVGGMMGLILYVATRAGLLSGGTGAGPVNPYGVVALGVLGGWYSKQATEKLAEIFETLFKTSKQQELKDKLADPVKPKVTSVAPSQLPLATPAQEVILKITGEGFSSSSTVQLGTRVLQTTFKSATELEAVVPPSVWPITPVLTVTTPGPPARVSAPFTLTLK